MGDRSSRSVADDLACRDAALDFGLDFRRCRRHSQLSESKHAETRQM
jgi:hypothetical protein